MTQRIALVLERVEASLDRPSVEQCCAPTVATPIATPSAASKVDVLISSQISSPSGNDSGDKVSR